MRKITGIILGGGKSSRMGEDKCFVKLGDKPFIEHLIDTLKDFGVYEIIINTNKPEQFRTSPHFVCRDIISNKGPLGGILSALNISKTTENIILPCDTPFISKEILHILVENNTIHEISIPKYKGRIYPLIGCYKKKVTSHLKSMISYGNLKAGNLIFYPATSVVDISTFGIKDISKTLANINDKETLEYYEKRI